MDNKYKLIKGNKLTLKNDVVFTTFFSRKGNEKFLIDFLNALLNIDIHNIHIRNEVSLEKLSQYEKGGRLDIQAELNSGTIVNIEMQVRNNHNIEQRTVFYSSKLLSSETKRGSNYTDLKQIIMINILDYKMLKFNDSISKTKIVLEDHPDYEVLKGIKWIFIELPKFRKSNPNMDKKINQWLAFIDNSNRRLVKMAVEKNDVLKKAKDEVTYLTGDAEIQRLQNLRDMWEMDRVSEISYERQKALKEGEKKGRIKRHKRTVRKKVT